MLKLTLIGQEVFDSETNEFQTFDEIDLKLEHSLLAVSKWEFIFQKPFLDTNEKTREETLGYIEAMILNDAYPNDVTTRLTSNHLTLINEYIDSPATATTFSEPRNVRKSRPEIITSELVYYWMTAYSIPFSCETWHLNRLFTLIRVCSLKNDPKKTKMSQKELAARNKALNDQRRAQYGTSG